MPKDGNTRKQLIDAAYQVLASVGYEAASIKEIAKQAGVSPGLVHYYFANKEELLSAVVHEATDDYCARMEQIRQAVPHENLTDTMLAELMERVKTHADWYRLRYELFVLGLRNDTIRSGIQEMLQKGREGISESIMTMAKSPLSNADLMAAVALSCFDGLAMQALIDPEFDLEGAYRVFKEMNLAYLNSRLGQEGKQSDA